MIDENVPEDRSHEPAPSTDGSYKTYEERAAAALALIASGDVKLDDNVEEVSKDEAGDEKKQETVETKSEEKPPVVEDLKLSKLIEKKARLESETRQKAEALAKFEADQDRLNAALGKAKEDPLAALAAMLGCTREEAYDAALDSLTGKAQAKPASNEVSEVAKLRAELDAEKQAKLTAQRTAVEDSAKLTVKHMLKTDERFETLAAYDGTMGFSAADKVLQLVKDAWVNDGIDATIEDVCLLLEEHLDTQLVTKIVTTKKLQKTKAGTGTPASNKGAQGNAAPKTLTSADTSATPDRSGEGYVPYAERAKRATAAYRQRS